MFLLKKKLDPTWEYKGENTKTLTHGLHNYPAMFIPQVAKRLITLYTHEGNYILDPFCGSGTVLLESMVLKRNSIGIDLNPLAAFLAKVKTTPIDPKLLQQYYFKLIFRIADIKYSELSKPVFFNIDFWFKEEVIYELIRIKSAIDEIQEENIKNFFLVAFSETVRRVSNVKNGEFKLVRMKKEKLDKFEPKVLSILKTIAEKNINGMAELFVSSVNSPRPKIIFGDSSTDLEIARESIDCIITSPPYGDSRTTVAYGQFSRLSLQWLGIISGDESQIDKKLLGGKVTNEKIGLKSNYLEEVLTAIKQVDARRAIEVYSFYHDIFPCLKNAYYVLKRGGRFCIVIGNRLVKGIRIPTDFILTEICISLGFKLEDIFVRNIPNKRMPMKNSPTNISGKLEETMTKESIVILQKIR